MDKVSVKRFYNNPVEPQVEPQVEPVETVKTPKIRKVQPPKQTHEIVQLPELENKEDEQSEFDDEEIRQIERVNQNETRLQAPKKSFLQSGDGNGNILLMGAGIGLVLLNFLI